MKIGDKVRITFLSGESDDFGTIVDVSTAWVALRSTMFETTFVYPLSTVEFVELYREN